LIKFDGYWYRALSGEKLLKSTLRRIVISNVTGSVTCPLRLWHWPTAHRCKNVRKTNQMRFKNVKNVTMIKTWKKLWKRDSW